MPYVGSSPLQSLAAVGLTALLLAVALLIFITVRRSQTLAQNHANHGRPDMSSLLQQRGGGIGLYPLQS